MATMMPNIQMDVQSGGTMATMIKNLQMGVKKVHGSHVDIIYDSDRCEIS